MAFLQAVSRCLLGVFFIAAGLNHFWHTDFYLAIMPPYLPWPLALVLASGAAEITLSALLGWAYGYTGQPEKMAKAA